jgi:hypothetical protein
MRRAMAVLVGGLLMLTGCVTLPVGPSVAVLPAPEKPQEVFVADEAACREDAARQTGLIQPHIMEQHELRSAVLGPLLGGAAGAALGAAFGAAAGNAGLGAATGAGAGLVLGTAGGAVAGSGGAGGLQGRYDRAYQQCMVAKGHQVPGVPGLAPSPPSTGLSPQ